MSLPLHHSLPNRKSHQGKSCLHSLAVSVARLTLHSMHSPFFLSSYLLGPAHFASFQPSFYTPSPLNALEIQNLLIQLSSENPIRNSSSSSSFSSAVVVGADERERMDQMFRYRVSSRRLKLAFSSGWIIPRAHWLVCKPASLISPL